MQNTQHTSAKRRQPQLADTQTVTIEGATIAVKPRVDGTVGVSIIADPGRHLNVMGEAVPVTMLTIIPGRTPRKGERVMVGTKLHKVADFGYDDSGILWCTDADGGEPFRWGDVTHTKPAD